MEVEVRCYAGYKGEERPVSCTYAGGVLEVTGGRTELGRGGPVRDGGSAVRACFRVRADDGKTYVLSRDEQDGRWALEGMTDSGPRLQGCRKLSSI